MAPMTIAHESAIRDRTVIAFMMPMFYFLTFFVNPAPVPRVSPHFSPAAHYKPDFSTDVKGFLLLMLLLYPISDSERRDAWTNVHRRHVAHKILWVSLDRRKRSFLAKIFILRKMQVSFVYHICLGLLNCGALLQ